MSKQKPQRPIIRQSSTRKRNNRRVIVRPGDVIRRKYPEQ